MFLSLIIKGILIGFAVVIPGLSASVFMVVTNMYDDLIYAINNIKSDFKKQFKFLLPVGIGAVAGILMSAKIVLDLCEEYTLFSYSFFIGLVIGSLPFVLKKIPDVKWNPKSIGIAAVGFIFIYIISILDSSSGSGSGTQVAIEKISNSGDFFTIFFAGAISVSLMTIPGVSGSVLLMILGQYGTIYNSVAKVATLLIAILKNDSAGISENLASVFVIIPFCMGALIGVLLIAKLLQYVLAKHSEILYTAVVGIVIAAVVTLFQKQIFANLSDFNDGLGVIINVLLCLCFIAFGVFLSLKFED